MLVVVAVLGYGCGCVGGGLIFFSFLAVGCGGHIEVVLVGGCSWPAVVVKCGDDPFVGFFFFWMYYFIVVEILIVMIILFYCDES